MASHTRASPCEVEMVVVSSQPRPPRIDQTVLPMVDRPQRFVVGVRAAWPYSFRRKSTTRSSPPTQRVPKRVKIVQVARQSDPDARNARQSDPDARNARQSDPDARNARQSDPDADRSLSGSLSGSLTTTGHAHLPTYGESSVSAGRVSQVPGERGSRHDLSRSRLR